MDPSMDLPEDLILDILYRLPTKKIVEFRVLNKGINEAICSSTGPMKRLLLHYPFKSVKLLCKFLIADPAGQSSEKGTNSAVRLEFSQMTTSSSGRLLIKLDENIQIIFNPLLGAYRIIPHRPPRPFNKAFLDVGLADSQGCSSCSFELVLAAVPYQESDGVDFFIFESEKNEWRQTLSSAILPLNPQNIVTYFPPVYLNDRMHWLFKNGDVLMFDVITESAELIPGNMDNGNTGEINSSLDGFYSWFGKAEGSLVYIIPLKEEMVVYSYDCENKLWETKMVIQNMENVEGKRRVVFWDGRILIILTGEYLREIYQYEIQQKRWNKIGELQYWCDNLRIFHAFVLTFAQVPGCRFLHDNTQNQDHLRDMKLKLALLQRHLTG